MGESHAALDVVNDQRLGVGAVVAAGGAVAAVADSHTALAEGVHDRGGENLVDKADVLIRGENAVVVDNYAAAFLTAVLKGKKAVIGGGGHVAGLVGENSEYSAFFVQIAHLSSPIRRRMTS